MDELLKMNLQLFAADESGEGGGTQDEGHAENETTTADAPLTEEVVRKMIQSETDRVRTEYVKRLKALEAEKEELQKQAMTEQERQQFEAEKRAKELEEKDRLLRQRELTLYAVDALREKGLPIEFRDLVVADDEEATKARLDTLANLFSKAVEQAVSERFAEGGRSPKGGDGGKSNVKNPWSKEHFNLTEQGRLLRENPELARQLRAAARG